MVGVTYLSLLINAIAFSFIFWALTFVSKIFYSNNYFDYKLDFYECGFKNITKNKVSYEINYSLVMLFLLVYDGEFLVLIPLALNSNIITPSVFVATIFFLVWLTIAILFDYAYNALEWQV